MDRKKEKTLTAGAAVLSVAGVAGVDGDSKASGNFSDKNIGEKQTESV